MLSGLELYPRWVPPYLWKPDETGRGIDLFKVVIVFFSSFVKEQ